MGLRLKFNLVLLVVFCSGWASRAISRTSCCTEMRATKGAAHRRRDDGSGAVDALLHRRPGAPASARGRRRIPAAERAGVRRDRDHESAAQEVSGLRLQGSGAQSQPIRATAPSNGKSDIVNEFRNNEDRKEFTGTRVTPTGAVDVPRRGRFRSRTAACLACHTTAETAPPAMVKLYGPNNGYRLEAERSDRRADRLGADVAADRERQPRLLHVHGIAGRGVRGALRDPQPDALVADRAADPQHVGGRRQDQRGRARHSGAVRNPAGTKSRCSRKSFNRMRRSLEKAHQPDRRKVSVKRGSTGDHRTRPAARLHAARIPHRVRLLGIGRLRAHLPGDRRQPQPQGRDQGIPAGRLGAARRRPVGAIEIGRRRSRLSTGAARAFSRSRARSPRSVIRTSCGSCASSRRTRPRTW